MTLALDALRDSSVFAGLSLETLEAVADAMETLILPGGQRLFAQGDPGDAAYVVLSGRIRVEREVDGKSQVVREAGRGELIGEFTMLTGAPRTASVRAVRQAELGRIPRDRFESLVKRHPSLALGMGRNLARLLGEAPPPPRARPTASVIVLRAVLPGVPLVDAASGLAAALRTFGRCALLTTDRAREAMGADDASLGGDAQQRTIETGRWLQRIEAEHDYVVCVADGVRPSWDDACIHQSDLLLDVLSADTQTGPEEAPPAPVVSCARDLVVLHGETRRRPTLAGSYLEARGYGHRHHLRRGNTEDFLRLARQITGRRVGFVLGGGGARGLAHIGLLRAASELGIPIDEIGGTSIGALVAVQWAAGYAVEDIITAHREGWSRHRPHKAYTLPLIGLVSSGAMENMLRPMFGRLDFADCWIDAFACSCDLSAPGIGLHRTGPVLEACMASMAIPGLGPAFTMPDRTLHVDGGLVSNLPARLARANVIVASDVSAAVPRRSGYPQTPSAWQVLRDRFRPAASRPFYPSLYHTIVLSTLVSSIREAARVAVLADLYIRTPIEHIGLFDFRRLDEAVEVGYREGLKALAPWWSAREAAVNGRGGE